MTAQRMIINLACALLLTGPLYAQTNRGAGHGVAGGLRGAAPGSRPASMPRGPARWSDFHHDASPARISPHRYQITNLPRPNAWHGDIRGFDMARWQGGQWRHVSHDGRLGWWWTVGPEWHFFDAPVYPYPDLYTPQNRPFGWWYWCDTYQEYYPYVTYCPLPWESVMPRE